MAYKILSRISSGILFEIPSEIQFAFHPALYLTFCLTSLKAFYLTYVLGSRYLYLASYYLAYILTLYLASIRVRVCPNGTEAP